MNADRATALVVYESLYGNTARIARAIAAGLSRTCDVTLTEVSRSPAEIGADIDLLVVGGPTQGHGMSRAQTRATRKDRPPSIGVREWLDGLDPGPTPAAAAFDTRFDKARWLTGSAARAIAGSLQRRGHPLLVTPESFFVEHTEGPLRAGEEERARRWAADLAQQAMSELTGAYGRAAPTNGRS